MNPSDIIENLRRYYSSYHDHKETLAYSATTLYVGAATAIALRAHTIFSELRPVCLGPTLLILAFVFAHAFIIWQLANRHVAATILHASSVVILNISASGAPQPNMSLSYWRDQPLPKVITDQIATRIPARFLGGASASSFVTIGATLLWSVVAAVALWC